MKGIDRMKNLSRRLVKRLIGPPTIIHTPQMIHEKALLFGKNAIVTGGSSGIGLEIAKALSKSGANVVIVGSNYEKLKKVSMEIVGGMYFTYDLSNIEGISNACEDMIRLFDNNSVDILVNSAGITDKGSFFEVQKEEFEKIFTVNVEATFFLSRAIANIMIRNKTKGHILIISSSSSNRPAATPYKLSKWSIRGLILGLGDLLLPYGITVNGIAPGKTATPMMKMTTEADIFCSGQPCGRYIMPEEIAELATFMVSDFGSMIVGDTVFCSGGNGTIMV